MTRLGPAVEWQIVGVYRDVRNGGPGGDGFPEIDVPFAQSPWTGVRGRAHGRRARQHPRRASPPSLRSLDPDLPMTDVKTMDQSVDERWPAIGSTPCSSARSRASPCCWRRSGSTA